MIREAAIGDAEAIARVHIASWRHFYAGIVPDEHLAGLDLVQRALGWNRILTERNGIELVAENEGEVVGFASGGKCRDGGAEGELYALYLMPGSERRGFGTDLALATFERLRASGYRDCIVWVLELNPARAFYEKLGGRPAGSKPHPIGGKELTAVAYRFGLKSGQ